MQVASRKKRLSREAVEAAQNQVQVAPKQKRRRSRPVAEAVRRNSAVRTIQKNPFPLITLGILQHCSLNMPQKDCLHIDPVVKAAILYPE
jgi:hypothetical protein